MFLAEMWLFESTTLARRTVKLLQVKPTFDAIKLKGKLATSLSPGE